MSKDVKKSIFKMAVLVMVLFAAITAYKSFHREVRFIDRNECKVYVVKHNLNKEQVNDVYWYTKHTDNSLEDVLKMKGYRFKELKAEE